MVSDSRGNFAGGVRDGKSADADFCVQGSDN